jgi:predicted transcriptional regulator
MTSEKKKSFQAFYETKVKDIMQTRQSELPRIDETADVNTIFTILMRHHHVWVTDRKNPAHLQGVITESDIIPLLSPPVTSLESIEKPDLRSLQYGMLPTAREIMSRKPVVTPPEETIRDALRAMKEQHIKQLAVVDDHGRLLGEICLIHLIEEYSTHIAQILET